MLAPYTVTRGAPWKPAMLDMISRPPLGRSTMGGTKRWIRASGVRQLVSTMRRESAAVDRRNSPV